MYGFITVRSQSSRLPRKCFLPFGSKDSVLSHVIKRAQFYNIIPVVCTTTNSEDDEISNLANEMKVMVFRGSSNNKLKRWLDCANFFNIQAFHTVDADDPFFDGDLMHKSFRMLIDENLDCVAPTKASSDGHASVGFSLRTRIIKKALKGVEEEADTEMMWHYLNKIKNLKMIMLSSDSEYNGGPLRLTLDYEEDYWLLRFIQSLCGNFASREEIHRLFHDNPDLYKFNYFRNTEWKTLQNRSKK